MKDCKPGARRHEHLDNGQIKVFGEGWEIVILDDGSTCDAVVEPVPPKYSAEQVLASVMVERTHAEIDARRNANKRARSRASRKGITR